MNEQKEVMPDFGDLEFNLDYDLNLTESSETPETKVKEDSPKKEEEAKPKEEKKQSVRGVLDLTSNTEEKEEEVKEEKPNPDNKEEESKLPEGADPAAMAIYQGMVAKNYIEENEDFKGTYEELNEIFEELPERTFESVVDTLNPKAKMLLQYAFHKGEYMTDEDFTEFFKEVVQVAPTDISDEDGQIAYINSALKKEGYEDEHISDLIEMWQEKGKLEERAKFYQSKENDLEKANEKVLTAKEEAKIRNENARKYRENLQAELDKTKWNDKRKSIVMREITSGSLRDKTALIPRYPKALTQLADFMTYFNTKTGEFDLSAYKKQGLTPSAKELKNVFEKKISSTDFTKGVFSQKKDKKQNLEDYEFNV